MPEETLPCSVRCRAALESNTRLHQFVTIRIYPHLVWGLSFVLSSCSCSDLVRAPTERAESHIRSETNTILRTLGAPALTRAGIDLSTRLPLVACPLSRFGHHDTAVKAVIPDTPSHVPARLVHPSMQAGGHLLLHQGVTHASQALPPAKAWTAPAEHERLYRVP